MANISLTDATRDKLISLKEIDRETYEDVILRLIKISEQKTKKEKTP